MTQTTTEKANITIVRKFFEVGPSQGDLAAADALLHPEFSLHTPLPTPGPGIEAMNNVITTCRAAFHGLQVTIDDIMADGDKVTARFTARGDTQRGIYGPSTHRKSDHHDRYRDFPHKGRKDRRGCGARRI